MVNLATPRTLGKMGTGGLETPTPGFILAEMHRRSVPMGTGSLGTTIRGYLQPALRVPLEIPGHRGKQVQKDHKAQPAPSAHKVRKAQKAPVGKKEIPEARAYLEQTAVIIPRL